METWKTTLHLGPTAVQVLLTDEDHNEVLKARLPLRPLHPRAVLTLMEGLALWAGHPITVALGAADRSEPIFARWLFGPDGWPSDSALVRFSFLAVPPRRRRTLAGVGDFRELRRLHRDGRSS